MITMSFPIVIQLALIRGLTAGPLETGPEHKSTSKVAITLRLSKSEATPGEAIKLEEILTPPSKAAIWNVSHRVLLIGDYDAGLGGMVNFGPEDFGRANLSTDFEGLPEGLGMSHPRNLDSANPARRGIELEVRPKRLGIYLITTSWLLSTSEISSAPIVLLVHPPIDAAGKPVVKPEWLRDK